MLFFKSLAALASGAIVTLAFAPYDLVWVVFISFAVLLYLWKDVSAKTAMWLGWMFGVGLQCSGVGWIYYSMHEHGGGSVIFSFLVIFLLSAYLAIYTALAGYLVNRFCDTSAAKKLMLLYPASFVIFEWLQGIVLTGFDWMQPGYTQIELPLSGFAPLLGNHAVGALVIATSGFIVYVLDKRIDKTMALHKAAFVIVLIWCSGFGLKLINWTEPAGDAIKVSLIQGNIAQELKWKRSSRLPTLNLYRDFTLKNLDSDLIVWPETALPDYQHRVTYYLDQLKADVLSTDTDVLLGVFIKNQESGRYFNSVIDLDGNAYLKRHLVPLGEFVPLRFLIEYFNEWMDIPMSDIESGPLEQPLLTVAGYPVSVSICFEDAFARDILRDLPDAQFLINVSNDAWFEDSREPHQHHVIARMRALESGRYMLRATNTGITSIIGPHGEEIAVAKQFERTVLSGMAIPMSGKTPYVFWGDWMLLLLCGLILVVTARYPIKAKIPD